MNQNVLSRDLGPKDYHGIPLLDHGDDEEVGYKNMEAVTASATPVSKGDDLL